MAEFQYKLSPSGRWTYTLDTPIFKGVVTLSDTYDKKPRMLFDGVAEPLPAGASDIRGSSWEHVPTWEEFRQQAFFVTKQGGYVCAPGGTTKQTLDPSSNLSDQVSSLFTGYAVATAYNIDEMTQITDEVELRKLYKESMKDYSTKLTDAENHVIDFYPEPRWFAEEGNANSFFYINPFWNPNLKNVTPEIVTIALVSNCFAQIRHLGALRPWVLNVHAKPLVSETISAPTV